MEDTTIDQDLAELREAVDKFFLKYENEVSNAQVTRLLEMLLDIKVEGVLKSQEDYHDYTTSTDYYDSGC